MGGFDFDKKDNHHINEIYICPACSLILREPFQLICSHRQCKSCIEAIEGSIIKCSECGESALKNDATLDRGCINDMKKMGITCSSCNWKGLLQDYEKHINKRHPSKMCEFCKQEFNSTNELDVHKQNCDKRYPIGAVPACDSPTSTSANNSLNEHVNNIHQISNASDHIENQTTYVNNRERMGEPISIGETIPILSNTSANQNEDNQTQEIIEVVNGIAGAINSLNDDTQRLATESTQLQAHIQSLRQDFETVQLNFEEQNAFLNGVQVNQDILQQDVSSLCQRVHDTSLTSYDGTLTWKVDNVHEKTRNAQSERQTSIYSPPFFSSSTGYKMSARLYLHGYGNARGTHMSLFFVLMRGPNDAILKFPFHYKVTFCLYDQTSQLRHIIDSFRPDIKSDSFQRPRSEMNIASGIPKFFPLAMVQQEGNPYVRDDTMFIKVMVDFGDMPRTLLPFALSLNPGIPTSIQQEMIRGEAERRAEQQHQIPTAPENPSINISSLATTSTMTSSSDGCNDNSESENPNNNINQ